ncbi:hypothetical protein [Streptomyces sp. 6N223]|uniref:hypothetical protein n=1 Tax=Streptomyces sp. 6N223 TaxID=3457412 RepID=UPI003FD5D77B
MSQTVPVAAGRSAIYGGGPLYGDGQAAMDILRSSGFTTVILWSIHVQENGDLYYNDAKVVSNGQYVGNAAWPARLRTLRQAPTSVNRIEASVGSAGASDWENIHALIHQQGTGPDSILYRNFLALKNATGADAINNDDESHYDATSTIDFARMTEAMGYISFTIVPYTRVSHWQEVRKGLGSLMDRAYLQVYAGGSGNDPAWWSEKLGMPVDPGLWCKHGPECAQGDSPEQVKERMVAWRSSAGIPGGFTWYYDDIKKCWAPGRTAADYARAINEATRA